MSEPIAPHAVVTPDGPSPEKTFTQAELDAVVGKRIAKVMKGMPDEAELSAFRSWKADRAAEQERLNTLTSERDTAKNELSTVKAELEQMKREKILIGKGVAEEDVEYYAYKIGKLVTDAKDFSVAAEDFFKDNAPKTVKVDMTGGFGSGKEKPSGNDFMNALLRGARK